MTEPSVRSAVGDAGSEDQAAANRRGIVALVGAMAIFIVSDVMAKLTIDVFQTPQMMVLRGLSAVLAVAVMLVWTGQHRRMRRLLTPIILVRSLLEGGATWSFLSSIREMPLASANTIVLATPLLMLPLAVVFLKERVTARRWIAASVGFGGVLLVLQPQGEWEPASLYAVACTAFIAIREIITRRLPTDIPTLGITLFSALAMSGVGAVGVVETGWSELTWRPFWLLFGAGVLNAWGNYLNTKAYRIGEASVISPFRYSTIPLSFAATFLVWGTVPTTTMCLGALLILGAGLVVLRGERRPADRRRND